jgi:periplasmic protein CpxP/Spy
MKKYIYSAILTCLIVSAAAIAQTRFTPQDRIKVLKEKLNLTDAQSAKIEQILVKSSDEMKKLRSGDNPDRSEMKRIRDESNQQIMSVLNDSQKAAFTKMQEERKNRWQKNSNNKNQTSK